LLLGLGDDSADGARDRAAHRGAAPDDSLLRDGLLRIYALRLGGFRDVHRAATYECTPTGACAEFRQSHANRHDDPTLLVAGVLSQTGPSAACTPLMP
jgi:hypothetical protein